MTLRLLALLVVWTVMCPIVSARVGVVQRTTPGGHTVLTPADDDREIQCVNGYLCIGNVNAACNTKHLHTEGVTHVISLIGEVDCAAPDIPRTLIDVWDVHYQDMTDAFSRANDVINDVRAQGGRVLVHCAAGVSRSSSTVIYHLMREHAMTYNDALAAVHAVRHVIRPNPGFERQLRAIEVAKQEL